MAAFVITREEVPIRVTNAVPDLGDVVTFTVKQQPRHLARVNFIAKVTVTPGAGDAVVCDPGKDGLDGVLASVVCNINDTTSGRRRCVESTGASLIAWSARKGVATDRYTKRAIKPVSGVAGAQTHWVNTPVHFMDPTLPDTVAPVTALPMYDSGDRPRLNEELEFKLTLGPANLNLTTGTAALADLTAELIYLENVGPKIPYVPTSLMQYDWKFLTGGKSEPFNVEKDGYLASLLFDAYVTTAPDNWDWIGGDPLNAAGRILIKQDNTDIDEFSTLAALLADDEYNWAAEYIASGAGIPRAQLGLTFMRDFLHTQPGTNGFLPYSMPRVWADSSRVRLIGEDVKANAGYKVLVHKFLTPTLNTLAGI